MKCLFASFLVALVAQPVPPGAEEMPIAELKPEYASVNEEEPAGIPSDDNSFVFLQKFPLRFSLNLFFHTEVLVCSRSSFSTDEQQELDSMVANVGPNQTAFKQVDESWWTTRGHVECVELGYGGNDCTEECCTVPHGHDQQHYLLNSRDAVISNAVGSRKQLFIYGTGAFDGNEAWHRACDKKCWSNWAGTDYNPITNNCNTFTSTVLYMVYGLSQKKPGLGVSDLITVHGHCPAQAADVVVV